MVKSFKDIVKETVNPPKSEDEQRFIDKHEVEDTDYPVKNEKQFVSDKKKDKSRPADNQPGEDEAVYEEMTDTQMKKREEIVKSMKKNMPSFKDRYGDKAKDVMYATATKMAMKEEAEEEVGMMIRQLEFISYAAEEIMEYLEMDIDPEEWFQNKLAGVHDRMMSLHAYMEGDKRASGAMVGMSPFGEEVELDEAETMYVIKHKKTKQVLNTHGDYDTTKDEYEGLGPDKKNYGVYKQTKKDAALRNRNTYREEVELDEEVSVGKMELKDGSTVTISKSDAEDLNAVMKELNPSNHKKMMERMSADKESFEEILNFAKAAQE